MLLIREQQIEVFAAAARDRFERDLAAHLIRFFPKHTRFLGEKQLREVVRHGIASARKRQFQFDYATFLYVDLMFMLGGEFDRDPQLPWVSETLNQAYGDEARRIDALYRHALGYFHAVVGDAGEHWIRAMVRARDFEPALVPEAAPSERAAECEKILSRLFPEKCRYVGGAAIGQFIEGALNTAGERGLTRFADVISYLGHAFFLGSGFERDPVYPWTSALVGAPGIDSGARMARVHAGTLDFLKSALAA